MLNHKFWAGDKIAFKNFHFKASGSCRSPVLKDASRFPDLRLSSEGRSAVRAL